MQTKNTRQLLGQTLRQKEKLVSRIEIQAKDFQSDIIPKRVYDFITNERLIEARSSQIVKLSKKKSLSKQYLERKFDHNSRDIEVFNAELSLLLNHYKQIDDKSTRK